MTDDELRAALRRVRLGPPGEWPFRYLPAVVVIAALLVPPVGAFDGFLLAGCVVAFVWIALLQWVRLHRDRVATRDELCETLRGLLEERVKWDRTMYPAMALVLVVMSGLLGVVLAEQFLSQNDPDRLPMGVAIMFVSLSLASSISYQHRVRMPEYRRVLDALSAPAPTPAPG